MAPRFYIEHALHAGSEIDLPPGPVRHVQVLRLQPGAVLTLFDGLGGEFTATVTEMGRSLVRVRLGAHDPIDREATRRITLAVGMPANDRMDGLIEKAGELGVAAIVPLVCERSVLRLDGERALRKRAHWQGVAIAASEQCGRTRLLMVHPVVALTRWLHALVPGNDAARWLLSLGPAAAPVSDLTASHDDVLVLSGPEGGLSADEEALAHSTGFRPVSLGARVLRADTAPLAVAACLGLLPR